MSSETFSHPSRRLRRARIRSLADTARAPLSAACLTALMATASCSPVIAQDADFDSPLFDRALAFVTDSARSVILSTYPDAVIHALDDALVVEADDATLAQIEALALRYELLPDPRGLALMHEAVYPQAAALQWSSCAALVNGSGPTPMIVAFKPPVAPALVTALAGTGAQVIGALPPSAFLVRADPTAADKLDGLSDLIGACTPYLPVHRISDRVPMPPSVGTVDIDVLTFPGVSGAALAASYSPSTVSTVLDREVVRLRIPISQVAVVAARSEVEWIDLGEHEGAPFNSQMRVVMQTEKIHAQGNPAFFNPIYSLGVWGESQIVTVADTGVEPHPAFAGPVKLLANTAAGACVTVLDDAAVHGISVLGVLAGDRIGPATGQFGTANGMDGLAVRSPTIMQDIESHTGTFCPPDDYPTALFQPALDQGSQIHNNSWGHWAGQGRYSWRSQAIDRHLALRSAREQVVVFSVGNAGAASGSGPVLAYTLSDEAHAKNSVSVGGSLNGPSRDWMYHFSSRGPAADCGTAGCAPIERVKPDVLAPAWNLTASLPPFIAPPPFTDYGDLTGTTASAPAVSAAAALIRDYFQKGLYPRESSDPALPLAPSSALVKALLVNATVPLFDPDAYAGNAGQGLPPDAYPNYDQGYGRPVLDTVLERAGYRDLKVWENASTLASTGSLWERSLNFQKVWNPRCNNLRVTLAWTDPAATLTAGPKLVNDLDLEVIVNGVAYRGNHRLTGNGFDSANNVEDVFIPMGSISGASLATAIRVYGAAVRGGRQPFAVVATFGPCFDNVPCDTAGQVGGCYRGPGDTVPGPVQWSPPSQGGCGEQLYLFEEIDGTQAPSPVCAVPPVIVPIDPKPIEPVEPIEPGEPIGPIGADPILLPGGG